MQDGESDIDDGGTYAQDLLNAVEAGLNVSYVKRALFNTFRIRFRLGLFDPVGPQPWLKLGMADVDTAASQRLNVEAARQSLVLLKNAGKTLPFPVPTRGKVVVIGASANSTRLLGGGHYARDLPLVDGFMTGGFPGIPQAIQAALDEAAGGAGKGATVQYTPGLNCTLRSDSVCVDPKASTRLLTEAVAAATSATQVVLVINLQSRAACDSAQAYWDGGEFNPCGYEAEQHDRPSVQVPLHQAALARDVLTATSNAGVPTVVVLVHGGALAIDELKGTAPAILDAHYPGTATGAQAVADAVYGKFSPAGKLPYSVMPPQWDTISNFTSMSLTDPPGRTYRYYPTNATAYPPVLFPFGWGLTYSKFNFTLIPGGPLAPAAVPSSSGGPGDPRGGTPPRWTSAPTLDQIVRVDNVGTVDSDEVVEVFFIPRFTRVGVPTPKKQLLDFERVHVPAGGSVAVAFAVNTSQLALTNLDGTREVVAGAYTLVFTNGVDATATRNVEVAAHLFREPSPEVDV